MTLKNTAERWGPVSQCLHWLIVLLILTVAVAGLIMVDLPRTPKYFWVYDLHKSIGLTLLALVVLRLGWRLYAGAPAPVAGTPAWQARTAAVTHWALYALTVAIPLSGWLYDSASGLRPLRWFKLLQVPKLTAPDEAVAAVSRNAHEWLFWLLVALVVLHAGAAFYHHLFQNDDTLARMLPGRRSRTQTQEPPHAA